MKKLFGILLAVVMMFSVIGVLVACDGNDDTNKGYDYSKISDDGVADANGKYELAVVTDIGALKDKGFNQGTWEGLKRYAYENNKSYKYYQPANASEATDDDRIAAMNQAVANGAKVIVAPGFLQATAMTTVATAHPEVKFVFIDGWTLTDAEGTALANVTAVSYKEQESGYLAGYAAVMEGYTKLGGTFGGGGTNPACNRFGYGYIQGAEAAAKVKNVNVEIRYSYQYGSSFTASTELQTQIAGWYNNGTQVVFSCGGSMFSSVMAAASAQNGKVIGVDVDQSEATGTVITSAVKGLRESVMLILGQYYNNEWDAKLSGKTSVLGAAEDATGLPTETWSMKNFTLEQYNELFAKIKNGTVTPSVPGDDVIDKMNDATNLVKGLTLEKVTVKYE